jgi:hypothetical protein
MALRMAAHDRRIRAVAAVSPPYSADIYWNVTLAGMRRELAALYNMDESEMAKAIDRITLARVMPHLRTPLLVAGGGNDLITPGSEAWRIFEAATGERELIYYPRGAHDCFNVLSDLRPRVVSWLARHLVGARRRASAHASGPSWNGDGRPVAEAVDPDFGDALLGDAPQRVWVKARHDAHGAGWSWPWSPPESIAPEVIHRIAAARTDFPLEPFAPEAPDTPDTLPI